ncbi:hypothetical protein CVS40_11793 [Lucilia cuprina]|nr:hypothetical protein CVS40_11793 [Lucilia cuprina]
MVDQGHIQVNRLTIDPMKYLNNLPDFDGNCKDLQTFTTLVDRVHPHLQTYDELVQMLFSDVIKSKLKGKAKQAIEINCHAISWTDIKGILQNNFGDRRSCDELFNELRSVTFKTNTVEFYNDIKNKLHRLNNKLVIILGETEATRQSATNNMRTALNIFKSKIPEPMKTILFCRNPTDLEQAMDILFQAGYAHTGNDNPQTKSNGNRQLGNNSHQNRRLNYNPQQDFKKNYQNQLRNGMQINHKQNRHYQQPFQNQQPAFQQTFQRQYRNPHSPFQNQGSSVQPYHNQRTPNFQNNHYQPATEPMDINTNERAANFRDTASGRNYHI